MDSNLSRLRILNRWRSGQSILRQLETLWWKPSSKNSIRHQKWDQKAVWQWKNRQEWRSNEQWCQGKNPGNQKMLIKQNTFRKNWTRLLLKICPRLIRNLKHTWPNQWKYWSLKNR